MPVGLGSLSCTTTEVEVILMRTDDDIVGQRQVSTFSVEQRPAQ